MGKYGRKKVFFLNFFRPKVFDMYFPKKVIYGVFELPLLRNAQKRHKKPLKIKKKKGKRYLPTPFSGHLPDIRGFQFYFSWTPLVPVPVPVPDYQRRHYWQKIQGQRPETEARVKSKGRRSFFLKATYIWQMATEWGRYR
jgi:hypothetical protein